jgi:carbon storage regulator
MLVLTRKEGDSITIGQNIFIKIVAIEGDRVRLGIEAPKDIRIYRSELLEETISINKIAADTKTFSFEKLD